MDYITFVKTRRDSTIKGHALLGENDRFHDKVILKAFKFISLIVLIGLSIYVRIVRCILH